MKKVPWLKWSIFQCNVTPRKSPPGTNSFPYILSLLCGSSWSQVATHSWRDQDHAVDLLLFHTPNWTTMQGSARTLGLMRGTTKTDHVLLPKPAWSIGPGTLKCFHHLIHLPTTFTFCLPIKSSTDDLAASIHIIWTRPFTKQSKLSSMYSSKKYVENWGWCDYFIIISSAFNLLLDHACWHMSVIHLLKQCHKLHYRWKYIWHRLSERYSTISGSMLSRCQSLATHIQFGSTACHWNLKSMKHAWRILNRTMLLANTPHFQKIFSSFVKWSFATALSLVFHLTNWI